MTRQNLLYRILNLIALFAMLFGLVPPVGATATVAVAGQPTSPTAPSASAQTWPLPQRPDSQDNKVFLDDPLSQALEGALRGSSAAELVAGGARLESLTTNPPAAWNYPRCQSRSPRWPIRWKK
jgi:hypothetical protein